MNTEPDNLNRSNIPTWQHRLTGGLRRAGWGILATLGFLLSPLSWWNDLWVNLPLAYALASLVSLWNARLFLPALTIAYWLTNLLGLVLLYYGAAGTVKGGAPRFTARAALHWLLISTAYTLFIVFLHRLHLLKPLETFFR
ncbi:MAG: hypothetical protein HY343_13680 [Lentisphaerae bacterium]|nr:hypothetical protein [Lentisphaerota bacterium]